MTTPRRKPLLVVSDLRHAGDCRRSCIGVRVSSNATKPGCRLVHPAVALPLYAIVDGEGRTVAAFAGLTRESEKFLSFLRGGLEQEVSATRSSNAKLPR